MSNIEQSDITETIRQLPEIDEDKVITQQVINMGGMGLVRKVIYNNIECALKTSQYNGNYKLLREIILLQYVLLFFF